MCADVQTHNKAVEEYMALDEAGRRAFMEEKMEVFVITDAAHPAKRKHESILKHFAARKDGQERGVRAKVMPSPACFKSANAVLQGDVTPLLLLSSLSIGPSVSPPPFCFFQCFQFYF
jgi:hypothetical protein